MEESRRLPATRRTRCRLGLHRWSEWKLDAMYHLGEWPWDTWQHVCATKRRWCVDCPATMKRGSCVGGWTVRLPAQPYNPTRATLSAAAQALLER